MRFFIYSLLTLISLTRVFEVSANNEITEKDFLWADSVMSVMTLDQKIGQLIIVTSYPLIGEGDAYYVSEQIKKYHLGGVIISKCHPTQLSNYASTFQSSSEYPLFIAMDAENGLGMRVDSLLQFPNFMTLGAIQDNDLLYKMGISVGEQCRYAGVNLNFSPVCDVNSNAKNPVINTRSFGELPIQVSQKSWAFTKGMQSVGVVATAKHFPGHGNTSYDSHLKLPSVHRSLDDLWAIDLAPFKMVIDSGICGVMSGHLQVNTLDRGIPASTSEVILSHVLKEELGFKGLVFTDAMNMKGIRLKYPEGVAEVEALRAGNDVVEFVVRPEIVVKEIKKAISLGKLREEQIDEKCRKVLATKHWTLSGNQPVNDLQQAVNTTENQLLLNQLYQNAITVVKNENDVLPIELLAENKIIHIEIGKPTSNKLLHRLGSYTEVDHYSLPKNASASQIRMISQQLPNYTTAIISLHQTSQYPHNNYRVTDQMSSAIDIISGQIPTILAHFGNPYALAHIKSLNQLQALIVSYEDHNITLDRTAQVIFGALPAEGKLPVSINSSFPAGLGFSIQKNNRLAYGYPEQYGFDGQFLHSSIDSIAEGGIREGAFPGCQVLVAKNGSIIFHEVYGHYTYEKHTKQSKDNLYDWASITKITGPLPLLMKMYEDNIIDLDDPFSEYWPAFDSLGKEDITFREILAHQSGLKPWIPFWLDSLGNVQDNMIYSTPSMNSTKISPKCFVRDNFKTNIYNRIDESELLEEKEYRYSGLAFYLFPELIEKQLKIDFDRYLVDSIFHNLGAYSICYNPSYRYPIQRMVPTEREQSFRHGKIQGYVHDEGCALMGGVSGNAGLFGTCEDLAKVMQFYLQGGSYGDFNYLKPETIQEFTDIQYRYNDNRRGLGFDKPSIDNKTCNSNNVYPAREVSLKSYGHSGYTGTFCWVDPECDLIYIFLSNRTYPTRENSKIYDLNIRTSIQHAIYQAGKLE